MPHKIVWRQNYVIRHFWGEVSPSEFALTIWDSTSHPQFSLVKYVINDLSGITSAPMPDNEVRLNNFKRLRDAAVSANPKAQYIIVTRDEQIVSLVKAFSALAPSRDFESTICASVDEALAWIDEGKSPAQ
jgi:hypothetical protein